MCGIVGYTGNKHVVDVLMNGLKKLEYRGYDSAGIAMPFKDSICLYKAKGSLSNLSEKLSHCNVPDAECGIGHTRWATHGEPSDINAHPHVSMHQKIAVVHNGIIENYAEIRTFLKNNGIKFTSDTDTEVIAQLIEYYYDGDAMKATLRAIEQLQGSFALGIICKDRPNELIATRRDSPLVIGISDSGNFIASDIPAFLDSTKKYMIMDSGEIAKVTPKGVYVYDYNLNPINKPILTATWDVESAEKNGYEHFMMKEIMEQPTALRDTIHPRFSGNDINLSEANLSDEYLANVKHIHIVACGSAWHAGVVGKAVIEKLTRVRVDTYLASEFRYNDPIVDKDDLCIVISQSGETADTVAALRKAKSLGAKILSVVNVVGSSIARESDGILYTWAGPEISVATTKAYSTQLAILYLFAVKFAEVKQTASKEELDNLKSAIKDLPNAVAEVLKCSADMQKYAHKFYTAQDAFYIGRGIDYAIALEGSLKAKEISYIHSEAFAAGELKHGPISLVEHGTFAVAIATQPHVQAKVLSGVEQLNARGAKTLVITTADCNLFDNVAEGIVRIPTTNSLLAASLAAIPLQFLAYYIATAKGCNVDKPRNLAKSVTVE